MDIIAAIKTLFVVASVVAITLGFILFTKITASVFGAIIALNLIVAIYKNFKKNA